jgi:hypothetical protein
MMASLLRHLCNDPCSLATNAQALLGELRRSDIIHAVSTWKDCYHYFAEDVRFTNLVGRPGSSPLDLFKVSGLFWALPQILLVVHAPHWLFFALVTSQNMPKVELILNLASCSAAMQML